MPDLATVLAFLSAAAQWTVWIIGLLGGYGVMAAAIFAGGWFIWRFVNDVLFP